MPARKGQRFGGRAKGTPNKPKVDVSNPAVAEVVAQEMRAREADPSLKEGRAILANAANLMMGLAARCQQAPSDPVMKLPIDPKVRETFFKALHAACVYAHWLAPYQSPTFKAVHLAIDAPNTGDLAKVINLKIFEDTGTAVGLMEARDGQADLSEVGGGSGSILDDA